MDEQKVVTMLETILTKLDALDTRTQRLEDNQLATRKDIAALNHKLDRLIIDTGYIIDRALLSVDRELADVKKAQ